MPALAVTFDVERFEWTGDDRLEVAGRWSGVRGRRFVRPSLDLRGDDAPRLLAVLDHKPWAAEDGDLWVAAFPWDGARAQEIEGAELSVATDIVVELPPPDGTKKRRFVRAQAKAPRDAAVKEAARPEAQRDAAAAEAARPAPTPKLAPSGPSDASLRLERDTAQRERDAALRERDAAVRDLGAIAREREAAIRERDAALRDFETTAGEEVAARPPVEERPDADLVARLTAERNVAIDQRDAARREAERLVERDLLERMRAERDTAIRQRDAALAERDAARRATTAGLESERGRAEREALVAEREAAREQVASVGGVTTARALGVPARHETTFNLWAPRILALGALLCLLAAFAVFAAAIL